MILNHRRGLELSILEGPLKALTPLNRLARQLWSTETGSPDTMHWTTSTRHQQPAHARLHSVLQSCPSHTDVADNHRFNCLTLSVLYFTHSRGRPGKRCENLKRESRSATNWTTLSTKLAIIIKKPLRIMDGLFAEYVERSRPHRLSCSHSRCPLTTLFTYCEEHIFGMNVQSTNRDHQSRLATDSHRYETEEYKFNILHEFHPTNLSGEWGMLKVLKVRHGLARTYFPATYLFDLCGYFLQWFRILYLVTILAGFYLDSPFWLNFRVRYDIRFL